MEKDLKSKTFKGMLWSTIERFTRQFMQFAIGIVLARLLCPADYGVIGLLSLFIAIADTFLTSGFGAALIQKKTVTDDDYCTAFHFNLIVSIFFYALFVIAAPWIANFYNMPVLRSLTPLVTLCLVFQAFSLVQTTRLTRNLDFRTQTIASLIATAVSGAVGISLACLGYGVWALAWQSTASSVVRGAYIWHVSPWRPRLVFKRDSFRWLWGFGSKILAASVIGTVYENIHTIIIGKFYKPADLGNFNRAKGFSALPADVLFYTLLQVNFPVLAKIKENREELLHVYKRLLQLPLFVMYPALVGMAAVADPMVRVVVGDKWLECVPLLIVLCLSGMTAPLTSMNLKLLYVVGRSDCVLKLELIKKPIAFAVLACTLPFGVLPMCLGYLGYDIIAFIINCHYTKKILCYGALRQIRDVLPMVINCAVMYVAVKLAMLPFASPAVQLASGVCIGTVSYLVYGFVTKEEAMMYGLGFVRTHFLPKYIIWYHERIRYRKNAIQSLKRCYAKTLVKLRRKSSKDKLKVVFLVQETSKWKSQSLYDLLVRSSHFEPVVALTVPKNCEGKSVGEVEAIMEEDEVFYHARALETCRAYDPATGRFKTIRQLGADVVFYQQPCLSINEQNPFAAAKTALTFYIPYYLPTYGEVNVDCQPLFHRSVFGHIILNQEWVDYYATATDGMSMAGSYLPLGHTMMDELFLSPAHSDEGDVIVYAPHFTFNHPNNKTVLHYSTFSENGKKILDYAKAHPEQHWAFKPHPTLYSALIKTGAMTKAEVDAYYDAWHQVGEVCLDGNYLDVFRRSRVLITDCGSFLAEYGATGKPVIRLVADETANMPKAPFTELFGTYYQVRNEAGLYQTFKLVLERGQDPNRAARIASLNRVGLTGIYSARRVLGYLEELLCTVMS